MSSHDTSPAGSLLRRWRETRGLSQAALSERAGVSARHLSFLETGRSQPSRGMVLRLAEALELPLRHRNAWLQAAGFAPLYGETRLDAPELAPVRRALERILDRHAPHPAFVVDAAWNVLLANEPHRRLLPALLPTGSDLGEPVNVMRLVLHPDLLRSRVENWDRVAHVLIHRIQAKLLVPEPDPRVCALYEEMIRLPGVEDAMREVEVPEGDGLLLPLVLRHPVGRLSWFSTLAVIGTPRDVTLDEMQIEALFPADEETEHAAAALIGKSGPGLSPIGPDPGERPGPTGESR